VIDPSQTDPVRQILAETGKRGVDVSFDCAAKQNTTISASTSLGMRAASSSPESHRNPSSARRESMRRKELPVLTVRRSNHDSETALHLMAAEPRRFVPILSHTRPLTKSRAPSSSSKPTPATPSRSFLRPDVHVRKRLVQKSRRASSRATRSTPSVVADAPDVDVRQWLVQPGGPNVRKAGGNSGDAVKVVLTP